MTSRDEQRRKRRSDSFRRDEADEADNWLAGLRGSSRSEPDPFAAPPSGPPPAPFEGSSAYDGLRSLDRPEQPGRPDRPDRADRVGRADRLGRPEQPGRLERSGTGERAASFDRPDRLERSGTGERAVSFDRTTAIQRPGSGGQPRGRRAREDSPSGVFGPGALPPAPPPARPANVDGWSAPEATTPITTGRRRAAEDDSPSGVYGRPGQLPSDASGESQGRRRARDEASESYDHGPQLTPIIKPLTDLAPPAPTDDPPPLVPIFPNMRPDSSPVSGAGRRARRAPEDETPAAFSAGGRRRRDDDAPDTGDPGPRTGDLASRTGNLGPRTGDFGSRTGDLDSRTGGLDSRPGDLAARAVDVGPRTGDLGSRTGEQGGRRRAAEDEPVVRTGNGFDPPTSGTRRDDTGGRGALYAGETTMFRPGDDTGGHRERAGTNGTARAYGAPAPDGVDGPRGGAPYAGETTMFRHGEDVGVRRQRAPFDDAPRRGLDDPRAFENGRQDADNPHGTNGRRSFDDDPRAMTGGLRGTDEPRGTGRGLDDDPRGFERGRQGPEDPRGANGRRGLDDPRAFEGGRRGVDEPRGVNGRRGFDDVRGLEDTGRRGRGGFEAAAPPDTARRDDSGVGRRDQAMRRRSAGDEPPQQRRALDDAMPGYDPYDEPSEVRRRGRGDYSDEYTSGGSRRALREAPGRPDRPERPHDLDSDRLDRPKRPRTVAGPVQPGPRPHRWVAMLSVVAVLVVLGACAMGTWFIVNDEKNGPDSAKSSTTSGPKKRDISSRDVDPKALTEAEVFPTNNIVAVPQEPPYVILATKASNDCKVAATEELATLLAGAGCSEVVRATMKSPNEEYLITAGIFNVTSEKVAAQTFDGIKPIVDGQKGRFAGMSVGAGTGTDALVRAPTQLGWNYKGHFITYCVIARVDGNNFAQGDPYPNQITYDIVETYLDNGIIENRAIVQPEATPAASLPPSAPPG
ncbi:hypothetical protein [Dactylosporangium sp. CA-233914]|uniref:hypothetical protein n=1 Tax=Dactylosporangium sp. CA-233914 TaxID=3239934 RepID=UPI003D8D0E0C